VVFVALAATLSSSNVAYPNAVFVSPKTIYSKKSGFSIASAILTSARKHFF
jgi:hypothetical protein